jgi:predicted nucleic acid-binding protein
MAMADAADPAHHASRRARDECLRGGGLLVSTDYVTDEALTLIRLRLGLRAASVWWDQVEGSSRLRWEWVDPARAEKARTWFFQWKDKDFSFTDCTSFVVMKELRIRRALTTDHHFAQAGFEMVP